MKRLALLFIAVAVVLSLGACKYQNPFSPQGQGYPDDPKAGEPTDTAPPADAGP